MADTKPAKVPALSKEERRKRQQAGLRPAKKGEVRNPTGKNGRTRGELIARILEDVDPKTGQSHIVGILMASIKRAKRSSDKAANFLIEQYGGKAEAKTKAQVDITSSDGSAGGGYPVVVQLPPNGRPMNEETETATEAQSDGDGAENS